MFEKALIMYIYAETPIHAGSGATLGVVDLPIQRERHTGFPIIQGSSLKGVLRNSLKGVKDNALSNKRKICPIKENDIVKEACRICGDIFGTEEGIGGVSITDAKILAFPVRTLKGVFGWITCPLVLSRYKRDLSLVKGGNINWNIPNLNSEEAIISKDSNLKEDNYVYIEELQLKCVENEIVSTIAKEISEALPDDNIYKEIKEKLKKDLVIVSNEVFRDLINLTTEIVTRIRIDPLKGIVKEGALWTEEYLPTDTILYSLILIPSARTLNLDDLNEKLRNEIENLKNYAEKIVKLFKILYDGRILQIGGDETIGKGFVRLKIRGELYVEKS
ncbi:MAG TPA: type III-B CRISPR module RAMP protein Cmr4 [Candidatus Nanopusillus sp.]|nr:type III-B CRISPR module RAMP protein Cmr4 [Candidatus Nanopusillus sp.]